MYYERTRRRVCQFKKWLIWLMPTKKQRWALGLLILATVVIAGRSESRRRDETMAATAKQLDELKRQIQMEIDDAGREHNRLQRQIDDIMRQIHSQP